MDSTTIFAAAIGGVPALVAAWFAYQASMRATAITEQGNRVAAIKVDAEAYERSQKFYESLMVEAEKHIERLRTHIERLTDQVDRLNNQLATEQDVSNVLRNQIRALTAQISSMELTLNELRNQVHTAYLGHMAQQPPP